MARHDTLVTLRQMLDHAREAAALMRGRTRTALDSDRLLNLALVRLLEIVGEAANRVPVDERSRYPAIAWRQLIGLRNRLIHAYDQVDLDILWQIVSVELPELIGHLEQIVPQ